MTETHSRTGVGRPGKWWEITMYRVARAGIWAAAKLFGGITITGAENIPKEGSFILAPVHRSNVDFALVALVTKRRMRYIAKDSLFKIAWLSKIWIALGSFPVARGTADRESLRICAEVIESGQPLVLFPEGTRQSGPVVQELFDGVAYLAGKTQVPIIPMGIGGSERTMPKGAKFIHFAKLVLTVGEPMAPPIPTDGGRVGRKALQATTAALGTEMQILFDEAQARTGRPNPALHDEPSS